MEKILSGFVAVRMCICIHGDRDTCMAHEILDLLRIHAGVNQICAEAVSQMVCCCMRKLIFVLAIIPINCCPDRFGNVHVELRTIPRVQKQKTGNTINNGFDIQVLRELQWRASDCGTHRQTRGVCGCYAWT